jgi:phenylacetic acid degradation operon negative regulatory protein
MPSLASAAAEDHAPSMSRRHAAGMDSARGLLFTILGEFMLPCGGSAWTSAFIEALGRLGVEEKASRQALTRTAADGWLSSERIGRRACWRLTPSAERLLTEGTERIYGFARTERRWDGRWLLVMARVPETDRSARHLLRTRLSWAGFGSPAPGIWVSTYPDRIGEAERVLGEAGLLEDAQIFVAEHAGTGPLATMVRQAWDLDAIQQSYEEFLAEFANPSTGDPLVQLIELVHAWRRFPWIDPALPGKLLPAKWSGDKAARLFDRWHATWAANATAEWRRINPAVG